MKLIRHRALLAGLTFAVCSAGAQMHKVAKPQQVVRAVGVYEWTGDMAKPTASRLIPVSIFIEGKLEDAGVYVARPVPFALLSGNVYELQVAGIDKGLLDLAYARHLQTVSSTGDLAYDDGWFGYGSVKPLAVAKQPAKLKPSKTLPVLTSSAGTSTAKPTTDSSADPDRPTMKRRQDGAASKGDTTTTTIPATSPQSAGTPSDDPDRPTMKRRSPENSPGSTPDTSANAPQPTSTANGGATPADDPDRPTLKRHSAEDTKKAKDSGNDIAVVNGGASLNDDPDRPNLHHGKPVSAMTEAELPKLVGFPPDTHQMVAVSDAANREPHEFALSFDDAAQRADVLRKMEEMARAELIAYRKPAFSASQPVARKTAANRPRRAALAPAPSQTLMDEQLKAYTLSYGGAATYIYMAHTAGSGPALRYVTLVAQADGLGELKLAIHSVTDATHLDRTPRMRFVDVVDAEASNRASLLFELKAQNSRQFGLYRVIAAHAEQIFLTGTTP